MEIKRVVIFVFAFVAAASAMAQFSVGISDSHYVYGKYSFANHIDVGLQHSLYSEKVGFQRICVFGNYRLPVAQNLSGKVGAYMATTWNGNYQVVGAHASLLYSLNRITVIGRVQPLYDSGLKYKTTYMGKCEVAIDNKISVMAAYTTIPEYRVSEKRVRGGFNFRVANIQVTPELSMSMEPNTRFKNVRVLMSMDYSF